MQTQTTIYLADETPRQAKSTLAGLNQFVTRQLREKDCLRLSCSRGFRKRKLKAGAARNPATGGQIKIPARTRLRFRPAKRLKDSVLGTHHRCEEITSDTPKQTD